MASCAEGKQMKVLALLAILLLLSGCAYQGQYNVSVNISNESIIIKPIKAPSPEQPNITQPPATPPQQPPTPPAPNAPSNQSRPTPQPPMRTIKEPSGAEYVAGEVIVLFTSRVSRADAQAIIASHGYSIKSFSPDYETTPTPFVLASVPEGSERSASEALKADARISSAEPNYVVGIPKVCDPQTGECAY